MPKSKSLIIGVTGGIGVGKSTVCQIFNSLGIPVYPADQRAKDLVNEKSELKSQIIHVFGKTSYEDGRYNTRKMAEIVFGDSEKLEKLNSLIHPQVAIDFKNWVDKQKSSLLVKEAALLFETGSYKDLDKIILIDAPEELRIKRIMKRDPHRSEEQIRNIIQHQYPLEESRLLSDWIITNDEKKSLIKQALDTYKNLRKLL